MTSESGFPWESVWVESRYSRNENRLRKAAMKLGAFKRMGALEGPLGRVLEIGCGNCTFVKIASESGIMLDSFIGVDKSNSALDRAKQNIQDIPNARLIAGDARDLPLSPGSIDTIIALGVLEHIADLDTCLRELARVSAPGARLLISTSNTRSLMYPVRLFRQWVGAWRYGFQRNDSAETLERSLRPFFKVSSVASLHGDRDFVFSTLLDKLIGTVNQQWGRYVLAEAQLKELGDL
nr:class I SAM-dependent methyltransferase [Burkholderia vietnamiensis]